MLGTTARRASIALALTCSLTVPACHRPSATSNDAATVIPPHPHVATVDVPAAIRAVVDAPDRDPADRALDTGRHPAETLAYFRIAPGQNVAELFAGGGYTSELLARAVGPTGHVYGENNQMILERYARAPWAARLAKPVMANVVRADRELDDPLPPEAHDLDAVIFVLAYHDSVWMNTNRAAMNRAVFRALKPGGVYGIVDHSARDGDGVRDVQTFHRIEEPVLIREVLSAGFLLDSEADFLRNPGDARDWNDSPRAAGDRRGTSDRFVLRFLRPG